VKIVVAGFASPALAPARRPLPFSRLSAMPDAAYRKLAAVAVVASAFGLAGCGNDLYGGKPGWRPHPGVLTALDLPIHGIDVARYQGNIDWAAVKSYGTRFAFIKATEGGDYLDPMFLRNWQAARAAGVPRGAYHFVFWCRPAHEQAAWFVQHIPRDPDALPPVLDLEWNTSSRTCPRKVPREVALEKARLMLRELEQHTGKIPIIYTDITFHKEVLEGMEEFNRYPMWLRSVAARPEVRYVNRPWAFWQYTATYQMPGIRGDVDRNAFKGTEAEFQGWMKGEYDPMARVWRRAQVLPRRDITAPGYTPPAKSSPAPATAAQPEDE
jgi:lysozyme